MKLKDAYYLEGSYDQPRQHIKKQRYYFASKGPSSQGYGFFSSRVWCECWTIKKAVCVCVSCLVVFYSLQPHRLQPTRPLHPWDSPGRNTRVGCHFLLQKKAECWRIDAFELWCWRRPLRVPWTARRFNWPILKEISPECSLEGLMLKLKLQYCGHLIRRADSFDAGKDWRQGKRMTEDEMVGWHPWLNRHEFG